MSRTVKGLFVEGPEDKFKRKEFERRALSPKDVDIDIVGAGICSSDLHQVRGEWGDSCYDGPGMCPGHEITGIVRAVGPEVTKFKVGDRVGIGCMVDSCRECEACKGGDEQLCDTGFVGTYNAKYKYEHHPEVGNSTFGGYSTGIVCNEDFVLRIPDNLDLVKAAPLLCAGATCFSPLHYYGFEKGQTLGVAGLGGLGHMAVKFGIAMGAKVVILSRGLAKKEDAFKLGAHEYIDVKDPEALRKGAKSIDMIIDTISAKHDLSEYLNLTKANGKLILLGLPGKELPVDPVSLVMTRRTLGGSIIASVKETQIMLDFCSEHNILPDVELVTADEVDEAYERVHNADVRYRCVIKVDTI
ncbi:Cinnamyl alcohol dehydrogenase 8 [Hondaea fermentalgiana]|uniref:Cinnamyl alcohol dehydrogenase 8 n=1 Tax=Hondaea fermentalgiana TaxID=2315210 RepID=A0A2R5GGK8_9STRA|nr:Cinnamyl alcohol dehydrogenase 8 [Hondaea fermentalgiana]|eukprot:GBG30017.1 Cinnamyl alcohol dehydrogenase 8 [Hondaea fermentalgiana]